MEQPSPAVRRVIEAAARTVFANRAGHDGHARLKALEQHAAGLELLVADAEARIAELKDSTSWRLTGPLRWGIGRLRTLRAGRPGPPVVPPSGPVAEGGEGRFLDPVAEYARWVAAGEPPGVDAMPLLPSAAPRPGLDVALLLGDAPADAAMPALAGCGAALDRTAGRDPAGDWRLTIVCAPRGPARGMAGRFAQGRQGVSVLDADGPAGGAELAAAALRASPADWVCLLHPLDRLAPEAPGHVLAALAQEPWLDVVFGDEDRLDEAGARTRPLLKPGWDPELLEAGDLFGGVAAFRAELLRQVGGPQPADGRGWAYALGVRAARESRPDRIRHVARVLCHRAGDGRADDGPRWRRVLRPAPQPLPLASLVIPTRDKPELLRGCVANVLRDTSYPAFEVLLLDNGTTDPDALAALAELAGDPRVRVVQAPGPFNWSALNNAGAAQARGSVLVLLNNDVAPLRPDWLDELVAQAVRPEVGAVGAKLLYPDGTVQHAGLAMDRDGAPKHLLRFAGGSDPGPFHLLGLVRSVSAVTGACLAVRRDAFDEVGGLNEALGVTYNDVEFCLRLAGYGYRTVWTPYALLRHDEMASRGRDDAPEKLARALREWERLRRDWGGAATADPYLNPNLVLVDEQPRLRAAPVQPPVPCLEAGPLFPRAPDGVTPSAPWKA